MKRGARRSGVPSTGVNLHDLWMNLFCVVRGFCGYVQTRRWSPARTFAVRRMIARLGMLLLVGSAALLSSCAAGDPGPNAPVNAAGQEGSGAPSIFDNNRPLY